MAFQGWARGCVFYVFPLLPVSPYRVRPPHTYVCRRASALTCLFTVVSLFVDRHRKALPSRTTSNTARISQPAKVQASSLARRPLAWRLPISPLFAYLPLHVPIGITTPHPLHACQPSVEFWVWVHPISGCSRSRSHRCCCCRRCHCHLPTCPCPSPCSSSPRWRPVWQSRPGSSAPLSTQSILSIWRRCRAVRALPSLHEPCGSSRPPSRPSFPLASSSRGAGSVKDVVQ